MRTADQEQKLYTFITTMAAAERLGGITPEHVVALGDSGELEVVDLRLPGAKRGLYRVNAASVDALIERRRRAAA